MMRIMYGIAALVTWLSLAVATTTAQTPSLNFDVPGPGDWNDELNWVFDNGGVPDHAVPGDGYPEEVAGIENGGTAFLDGTSFPIDGLIIAPGKLEIRNNGTLVVQEAPPSTFMGMGTTVVGGGGTLEIIGNGKLTTDRLSMAGGTLAATLTGTANNPIQVTTAGTLGGNLTVGFQGFEPTIGQTWKLIDAPPNQLTGTFTFVSGSSLPLGAVIEPIYDPAAGDLSVGLDNRLVLSVNRRTGAATISNAFGAAIDFDGYTIHSPAGLLVPNEWESLDEQNTPAGWFEANPTNSRLSELKPIGSTALPAGQSLEIGNPYHFEPAAFGEPELTDLEFKYFTPSGEVFQGVVDYTGPRNNIVLLVDPATGEAAIQNQSTFTVGIDFYTITSASGSLDPDSWVSLEDQNVDSWAEARPTTIRLSELLPIGATTFTPNKAFELGTPFTVGGDQDLAVRFALADGTLMNGIVTYGAFTIGGHAIGDTNGDGTVDLEDLNNVRNFFGTDDPTGDADNDGDTDLDDLNAVRNFFGTAGGAPASVPEPTALVLALLGVPLLAKLRLGNRLRG